ncbi:DUF1643 domain-containing protein [Tersicoccus sp. MR15.9]|uniref:DUF1643 domain-containing protein n=1 Tax=Tersicoccus mangrovi TaxID=3121635 RepID=UPI002FE64885
MAIADAVHRDAVLSADGVYRYRLTRTWGEGSTVLFVMLNPSTADHTVDDPTIRRCIGFARAWGHGSLTVANLYAYRATKPADLWRAADPVGPDCDEHLAQAAAAADRVIVAWGAHGRPDRVAAVHALLGDRAEALKLTAAGAPGHPLYIRADTVPVPWAGLVTMPSNRRRTAPTRN